MQSLQRPLRKHSSRHSRLISSTHIHSSMPTFNENNDTDENKIHTIRLSYQSAFSWRLL